MNKKPYTIFLFCVTLFGLSLTLYSLSQVSNLRSRTQSPKAGSIVIPQNPTSGLGKGSLQLQTFPFITLTPSPTKIPTPTLTKSPSEAKNNSSSSSNNTNSQISDPTASNTSTSASDNNCGGKYAKVISKNRRLPKNFGDPSCDFTKDKVYALLKKLDPPNADWWFHKVIKCESGYNPNIWRDPNLRPRTPDPGGAWGLYQTGSTDPAGQPPNVRAKGGVNDRGDVIWQIQTENAVKLLKQRSKRYWACA